MKLLCTGDLHLGRSPSRLPADLSRASISVAERWREIVDLAIREEVDVVAMSGDLVDRANRFFEAYGPLESGIRRLAEAAITTVAVAGNHDFDILPQLSRTLPAERFRLLGASGVWERVTLTDRAGDRLDVHGWSFPSERVSADPLDLYALEADPALPTLGLLHCELNASGGRYAPVSEVALRSRPPGLWLLGHVHDKRLRSAPGGADLLYPGSPQPLDPGEPGAHGVWLVETAGSDFTTPRFLPTATVRYESLAVEVDGVDDVDGVRMAIATAAERLRDTVAEAGVPVNCLSLRIDVVGRSRLRRRVLEDEVAAHASDLDLPGEIRCVVERVRVITRPALDLEELTSSGDAPGVLARLLVSDGSGAPTAEVAVLVEEIRALERQVDSASVYLPLRARVSPAAPYRDAEALLREQANLLLEELVAQKGGA
ncbi:MAG: DNA repair exonuclease [Gemmatimonadota bacterium]